MSDNCRSLLRRGGKGKTYRCVHAAGHGGEHQAWLPGGVEPVAVWDDEKALAPSMFPVHALLHDLRKLVDAACSVSASWEACLDAPEPEEHYPKYLPDFDTVITDLIIWRDSVARSLGVPEGDGSLDDQESPPFPGQAPDEPDDPSLDVEGATGLTAREILEAVARRKKYLGR